jgi:preprotein translocase subunit SecY
MLLLYRLGSYLPVPGVPVAGIADAYAENSGIMSALGALNMFSGGAMSRMSFFALGTMPYITAQIIIQMAGAVIPTMGRMNEDEAGRRKTRQWTRYLTIGIAAVNAIAYLFLMRAWRVNFAAGAVPEWMSYFMVVGTMVVGALVIMWVGELIDKNGVGNGMSLIIAVNILSGIPSAITSSWAGGSGWLTVTITLLVTVLLIPLIVKVERGQRRIPITYSKQIRGQSVIGGGSTYLPIKVNFCGVIPIIFATTVLALPSQLAVFFPQVAWVQSLSNILTNGWVSWLFTFVLIVFFSYFYSSIVFDPDKTADDIQRAGGFVQGFRPGAPTANYIRSVVDHITLPGALMMACLSVIPSIAYAFTGAALINTFGGTSTLILVGVIIDTAAAIDAQSADYGAVLM